MLRRLMTCSIVALALSGCANAELRSGETDLADAACTLDRECDDGFACVGGVCTESDAGSAPDGARERDIGVPPDDTDAGANDAADTGRADAEQDGVTVDTTPTPDVDVDACEGDGDCPGGYCVERDGGAICAYACGAGCPPGFRCVTVEVLPGAEVDLCLPADRIDCDDADGDRHGVGPDCLGSDCDEGAPDTYEGADELCDELDNDCDAVVDEEISFVNGCGGCTRLDGDPGDGCGRCGSGTFSCDGLEALRCDGEGGDEVRNECGGCAELEGAPGATCGACGDGTLECAGGEAVTCRGARPAPAEVCDGEDNDCDDEIDEGNPGGGAICTTARPGACAAGTRTCVGGEFGCAQDVPEAPEICDGADNDCDAATDEGVLGTYYQDADGDGAGNPGVIRRACVAPAGYVTNADDCNDSRTDIVRGECTPGETRTASCGNCGTGTETCSLACTWALTGSCTGTGECAPGTLTTEGCGACSARECSGTCSYETACGTCTGCSSRTLCGSSCPDGYHPTRYGESLSCGSSGFGRQTTCAPSCGSSLTTCGFSCPSGYHPSRYAESLSCSTSGFGRQTVCNINAGRSFTSCGNSCPDGYVVARRSESLSCSTSGFGSQVVCERLGG